VTLTGYGAVPELQIDPATYDFGPVVTGCTQSVRVTLRNVGVEPLTVSEALWTLPPGLSANDYPMPLTLGPTETTFVELTYTAGASAGPVEGTLVVASNDPRGERNGVYQGLLSPADRAV
jgi:hypothetical protein